MKMEGIRWAENWSYKIMEFKYNQKDESGANKDGSGARYGMVAFGKDNSGKFVDCMYVLYKMDFTIAPEVIITEKKKSYIFGLFTSTSQECETKERTLGVNSIKVLQNFFRAKALQGFHKEGLVNEINWVQTLEETDASEMAIMDGSS